jgi:hypothetical protein
LHLSVQETGILVVDALDFILEAFFFLFVNFAVLFPHHGLLVVENLLGALTGLLLLHLLIKIDFHVGLLLLAKFNSAFILQTKSHLALHFITMDLFVFGLLLRVLSLDDS